MPPRRLLCVALAVAVVGTVGACSEGDGRALPAPEGGQGSTPTSEPVVQPSAGVLGAFTVESPAYADGGVIPPEHTCNGADVSPELSWTGVPTSAVELAIVMRDRDADGFIHWIVTGIQPYVLGFAAGSLPENAVEQANSAGRVGWLGPCPPAGSGTHTYELIVHALPGVNAIPADATAEEAAGRIESTSVLGAALSGTVTAGG
jgi:Raf kinase inhibitor-like YbhB/YbcL family protein